MSRAIFEALSGGTITLDAEDSAADNTIDLPAATGTLLVPATVGSVNQVLTSNGTTSPTWEYLSGTGTVTSVNGSGGSTGLTLTGGPITSSGTLTLGGVLNATYGGTGAVDLIGYVFGNGANPASASMTIPNTNISGLGTMATQDASAVAISGGSINGVTGVTSAVSVASANGFAGTSSGGVTPALTLTTSISGVLKGNGTALSAATAGTDFVAPATATNFTAQQYFGNATLTDAATVDWAANTAQTATFTFVSTNRTMGAPTGLVNGAFYALAVIQNGGSNTLTWNSVFKWTGGTAPTLSTAASAKDYFVFRSDGTNLYEQGRSLGVA
tara:strand:+ start:2682 stop:3668 length:987 start_codon:yes stop_codon:yes gene_type:complete